METLAPEKTLERREAQKEYSDEIAKLEEAEVEMWAEFLEAQAYADKCAARKLGKQTVDRARGQARKVLGAHDRLLSAIGLAHRRWLDVVVGSEA